MRGLAAVAIFCCMIDFSYGQLVLRESSVITETYGNDSIPDISNRLSLISLARNRSVQGALNLTDEQLSKLDEIFRQNGGSLSVVFQASTPASNEPSIEQQLRARQEVVDELLTPWQWDRLRQVAYQVEISRVGLAHALTTGRLSRDAGIHENQRTNLNEKANKIQSEVVAELTSQEGATQQALLEAMKPEASARAKRILGAPFFFQEDNLEERKKNLRLMRGNRLGVRYAQLPDGSNKVALASLLLNRSVRNDLAIDDTQTGALIEAFQKSFGPSLENRLDELVSPTQWKRLQQIVYQIEIDRDGLEYAIRKGKLGSELGLSEAEKESIGERASELEIETKISSVRVWQEAQSKLIAELSPQQRSMVKSLLGVPFQFRDEDYKHFLR